MTAGTHRLRLGPGYRATRDDSALGREDGERGGFAGCIAGALSVSEYVDGLGATGFEKTSVSLTHEIVDGLHGAIVRASKPR